MLKPLQSKKPPVTVPRVIILSLSGMRCADVVRAVKPFKGQGEVAKVGQMSLAQATTHCQLFAKHFKFEDQVKYLAKTRVSIAVGTPARVSKLLAEGESGCLYPRQADKRRDQDQQRYGRLPRCDLQGQQ